jgi:UDP-N-acetylmuramoyl-tripeptide--D-alanyl-D-alanine ligase
MFSTINITIFILWFLSAALDYAEFTYLWQLKEYRWDKFKDFLSTRQGKIYMASYSIFRRSLVAIAFFFWPINDIIFIKYILLGFFVVDVLHGVFKKVLGEFRRPNFTKKALLIIFAALLVEGLLFIFKHDWVSLLILLVMRFFLLSFVVYIFNKPTYWIKKYLIKKATKKMENYKDLTVVGITGSYGKTTVKTFLDHILSKKLKVVSTPKHVNTEIGIAKFILKNNFDTKNIFIVEMGAYTEGEIKLICDMVKPKVGILTAINEQHASLFGNIEKTQKAKYELLRSIPKDGLVVTNADNKYCREFLEELDSKIMTFGLDEEHSPTIFVKNIKDTENGGIYTVKLGDKPEATVESNLRGSHNVTNVMPCVLVSSYLGMTREEIIKAIETLPQTIRIYKYGKCDVIDDSYNSNPNGFRAMLDFITKFKYERKRIVLTRGMLELGERSNEIHEQMAGEIAYTTDELVLITPDFEEPIRKGAVGLKYNLDIKTIFEPEKLLKYIKSLKETDAVILLENRIPSIVIDEIKNNSKEI